MHYTMNDKNNNTAPDLRPKSSDSDAYPMEVSPSIQLEHQFSSLGAFIRPIDIVPPAQEARTWRRRVEDAAMFQPINQMTLYRLRSIENEIRNEAAALREETREHVEAIALVCAFKLEIMRAIEQGREDARESARKGGRIRYVD